MKIVKIIYANGNEKEVGKIIPLEILENDNNNERYQKRRSYERQFKDFEENILNDLDPDAIEAYAEWNLNLVKEDDVVDKDISDFDDDELLKEAKYRKLSLSLLGSSIITEKFMVRFEKIIEAENALILEKTLTEFESKLNL